MNVQDSWKKTDEIEIDLADLLKKLAMRWKQMLLCAVAAALFAGGYGCLKNNNGVKIQNAQEAEDIAMTQEEEQSVRAAVQLQQEIIGLEQYLDSSVLMRTDPYHKHKTYMLYSIEQADWRDVPKITESYLSFVANGGAADALQKRSREWDMDKSCLAEIMTAYQKTYSFPYQAAVEDITEPGLQAESVFYVELTGTDDQMAGRLADDMQKILKEYSLEIKKQSGNHRLKLAGTESTVITDSSLLSYQRDKRAQLAADIASLKSMTDVFSDKQMAVYESEKAALDQQKKGADGKLAAENSASGHSEEGNKAAGGLGEMSSVLKYIILGFAGGIFLYGCVYGCRYLFQDTVKSAREMKELYVFPLYGCIPSEKKGRRGMNGGQEAVQLINRVRLACKKQGITKLCLAADFSFNDRERECLEQMAEELKSFGIDAVAIENASSDTAQWDGLAQTGTVIFVCRIGTTTHRMIDDAVRFYQENDVDIMGAMAFGCNG